MKEDDARDIYKSLRDDFGKNWNVSYPDKDVNERRRRVNWTVTITQKNNLGQKFRFPTEIAELAAEHDNLFINVNATDRRVRITLDNPEANELELTEEEKARKQLEKQIRLEFDLNRNAIEALADEYDSVDEIVSASREELTAITGIGERRATEILHRRSDKLKQRMQETSDERTIPVVEDADGVLRLPEEFEDGEHTPKHVHDE